MCIYKFRVFVFINFVLWVGSTNASAEMFPKIKAGLWETTMAVSEGPEKTKRVWSLQCIDTATLKELFEFGVRSNDERCSKNTTQISGNKITVSSKCNVAKSIVTSKTVTTFDSDVGYRTESISIYEPAFSGRELDRTLSEVKHIGPCKAGMRLGDALSSVTPTPVTVNMLDVIRGAKKPKQ